ncbi:cholesteryl ester transfer protein [Hemicordylus capensis]|uniref:cholesteryl ester transfer protein n=1 Tax=Hemicordylus capensis TaxID=884348 RepID=UPI0023044F03|nr:cholesteryl ester transfer protein [Hemicordylus capensis]XP_053126652.1 cholesteryl ester transfer protein [Hemicordylus capensis]XP_053126653.1 cholesteryl ester transfer protein [Hemicordylus capensis]XP_053126654.1 cholesteryl ester transfer protein [Hemicordylus capensis]
MKLRILGILVALISWSFTCHLDPSSSKGSGIVFRITKPAALVLNEQTAQVIQTAFHQATYPDIKGEKYVRFLGGVTYGLTNIHIGDLSIENSTVDFKEDDAIDLAIQNVSASFKGTLSYGYVGAWLVKLIHNIDFEIDSSIDLQINIKLNCENERVAVDTSDCYLTFHKLTLHLQGDRDPGWLKQLFTNFISFTLKLVLKSQVCKEINFLSQLLADFIQDRAANFLQDGDIGVDTDLTSAPVIKSNYIETHHKGLLLYKNYTGRFCESAAFTPSLLTESRMLYFWFSEHVLKSLALAAFLDERLVLTIAGEELKEMFDGEELETHQKTVQEIFQGPSSNDSLAKVWSLDPPEIVLQPEGTVVKSTVAVELNVSSHGGEPSMRLYFEKEVTVTIQASYGQKKLFLHLTNAVIESKMFKCSSNITVNDETVNHLLEKIILAAGIPEVISRIEPALTSLMDSKGLYLFEIKEPEIITRKGYFIIQMDFSFPHHLLIDFLKTTR